MTALETVNMVRMLLDDSRDWFPTTDFINQSINDAQIQKIKEFYMKNDERALRPLYRKAYNSAGGILLIDGELIYDANGDLAKILYPRSCKITKSQSFPTTNPPYHAMAEATYLENSVYLNFVNNTITLPGAVTVGKFVNMLTGERFPRAGYYTIHRVWNRVNNRSEERIHFVTSDRTINVATLWYITVPDDFVYVDNDPNASVDLVLPPEYHIQVASLAAEIINRTDVDEMQRSQPVAPETQLDYTQATDK